MGVCFEWMTHLYYLKWQYVPTGWPTRRQEESGSSPQIGNLAGYQSESSPQIGNLAGYQSECIRGYSTQIRSVK